MSEYFSYLVEHAEKLLADGDYDGVASDVLSCHNNLRSGWTDEVSNVFHHPKNSEQKKLSEQMASVIERTVGGLLQTAQPGADFMGFILLEHMAVQLYRLGQKAPKDQIEKLRKLLEESHQLGAPELLWISVSALELLSRLDSQNQLK